MASVLESIKKYSQESPDKLAVVFENDSISYRDLWNYSLKLSSFFKSLGIKAGSLVVVQTNYTKWFVVCNFAAWLSHAVFVPIDSNFKKSDLSPFVFTNDDIPTFESVVKNTDFPDASFPSDDDFANIMFTTGTTGNPKGVVWTHKNILENCKVRSSMFGYNPDSVDLSCVPLNHAAPLWKLYALTFFGGTAAFVEGLSNPLAVYNLIQNYKVNSFYTSPAGASVICRLAPEILSDFEGQIRTVAISSSNLSVSQKKALTALLPNCKIIFSYGSSETGCDTFIDLNNSNKESNCVGQCNPGVQIRIVDQNMNDVPVNTTGKILIKSAMNFAEYRNLPELTKQCFFNDFFITSDLGFFDGEGNLFIVGRADDIINIGGLKVYPSEIENVAQKIPGVCECLCFAVNDNLSGQSSCLLVKSTDSSLSSDSVKLFLSKELDLYKIPKFIRLVDFIEKTSNGKPNRKFYSSSYKPEEFF